MKPRQAQFNLLDTLKDRISGFQGVVMGITHYATGCTHYGLAAKKLDHSGKPMTWEWFDESRLVLVKEDPGTVKATGTSGPDMNPRCK